MLTVGPNYNKLKTNLRLAMNRLKLLQKKKTEQAMKARKEIADYISLQKEDRARIRVEHIIREDYTVEAYEILEMFCDLVLARMGLIEQMKTVDEGIEEAVNSVLWVAPRLQCDVQEFKIISDIFTAKYGKPYVEACRENRFGKCNPKLMHKMAIQAPPRILVERYMVEIAKSHGVPFTPDMRILREDEVAAAEQMLIDFQKGGGASNVAGEPAPAYGWSNTDAKGGNNDGGDDDNYPPPPPYNPGGGSGGGGGSSGGGGGGGSTEARRPFDYPVLQQQNSVEKKGPPKIAPDTPHDGGDSDSLGLPALPEVPTGTMTPPTNQQSPQHRPPQPPPQPPAGGNDDNFDFDDLSRRFEELKKRR